MQLIFQSIHDKTNNWLYTSYLLSSRLYCRLRNLTESALRTYKNHVRALWLAGCTAGRESHPALKIFSIHISYYNSFEARFQEVFKLS